MHILARKCVKRKNEEKKKLEKEMDKFHIERRENEVIYAQDIYVYTAHYIMIIQFILCVSI